MKRLFFLAVALSLALSVGCATSQMADSFKSADYKGGMVKSVMVLGVAKKPKIRQAFENSFSADLAKAGVKAEPGYKALPEGKDLDGDVVAAAAKRAGMQTVMVVHYRGYEREYKEPKGHQYGPDYASMSFYLPGVYNHVNRNEYANDATYLRLECNLYDVKTQTLIWTGHSKLVASGDRERMTADLAGLVVAQLKKDGLLP